MMKIPGRKNALEGWVIIALSMKPMLTLIMTGQFGSGLPCNQNLLLFLREA